MKKRFKIAATVAAAIALIVLFVLFYNFASARLLEYSNDASLELKTSSRVQPLDKVKVIGNRVGEKAPDFTVITTDSKAVKLSDFAKQKKPVVVYFMATWCPWCKEDYKALSNVYKYYEGKVAILSISLDLSEDIFKLREYKKQYPELGQMVLAPGQEKILIDYSVTKTTTKYALNSNGTIMHYTIGAFSEEQWKILLDALEKS